MSYRLQVRALAYETAIRDAVRHIQNGYPSRALPVLEAALKLEHRPNLMAGLMTQREIASELGTTAETIRRYRQQGMPYAVVLNATAYDPAAVRAWLMTRNPRTFRVGGAA